MLPPAPRWQNVSSSVIRQRSDLKFLEGVEVEVSGRVKESRRHEKRRDLDTLLLTNLVVNPIPIGESIAVHHMWFLRRQFKKIGRIPEQGERIQFVGIVYLYCRLGGKSKEKGLLGHQDYGIRPLRIK
jgi:hypothetical protein